MFAKQEKDVCVCVPKSLLMPTRKADLVLIPATNMFTFHWLELCHMIMLKPIINKVDGIHS